MTLSKARRRKHSALGVFVCLEADGLSYCRYVSCWVYSEQMKGLRRRVYAPSGLACLLLSGATARACGLLWTQSLSLHLSCKHLLHGAALVGAVS